jgi:hypothetical protein
LAIARRLYAATWDPGDIVELSGSKDPGRNTRIWPDVLVQNHPANPPAQARANNRNAEVDHHLQRNVSHQFANSGNRPYACGSKYQT